MGQEFHVVRCFSCQSFQVQQVKKVNKWSCKLCGKKQTLLKEFGRGSGADCRRHVQKLNAMRGAVIEEQEHNTWSLWEQAEEEEEEEEEEEPEEEQQGSQAQGSQAQGSQAQGSQAQGSQAQVSRWIKYLDAPEEAEPEEEDEEKFLLDMKQLHANRMTDGKRKRGGWTHTSTTEQQDPPSMTRTYKATQTSQNQTNQTSPTQSSPPSKRRLTPPSSGSGPGSRWACFLRSDREVEEGEETSGSGRCRPEGGAAVSFGTDVIPTLARPGVRPLLPVSSMFESGEEFIFDDSLSSSNF